MSALTTDDRRMLVRNLDPLLPLEPGSLLHVQLEPGEQYLSAAMRELHATLDSAEPAGSSTQLITGFPGTGKTTELRRLRQHLQDDRATPTEALLIDGEDYIDPYSPLEVADVLRVLAHTLDNKARDLEGKKPDDPDSYWQRFSTFLSTEVELKNLKIADGMLELRANPTFRKQVRDALKARFQVFVAQARSAIQEAVARICKKTGKTRVVVIFDSLEKIRALDTSEAGEVEASLERVFLQHADLLKVPNCHLIYTFPLALRYLVTGLGTRYGSEPVVVPMVSVSREYARPGEGFENEEGLGFLRRLVVRRLDYKEEVIFGPEAGQAIRDLAAASGGYPRDLIRLVRNLVQQNREFPVPQAAIDKVITALADEYAQVYRDTYAEVLKVIGTTHRLPQNDDDQTRLLARLIQNMLVLAYRNGREWYDIHPLLRRHPPLQRLLAP